MFCRRRCATGTALVLSASIAVACSSPADPFTSGPGRATVTGLVADAAGVRIAGAVVAIDCADGAPGVRVTTDSAGRYLTNLETGPDPFDGSNAKLRCHLSEPAAASSRAHVDTSLTFARGPVLVILQTVDLREP